MKPAVMAPIYVAIYPELAELFRTCGYALSIHGSLAKDFDLVAIPWGEKILSVDEVLSFVCSSFGFRSISWTIKNHGRLVHTVIMGGGTCYMDLSFVNSLRPASLLWSSCMDSEWRLLGKDEVIQEGDETDQCSDPWRDPAKWGPVHPESVGGLAPDPAYPSHRLYRRRVKAESPVEDIREQFEAWVSSIGTPSLEKDADGAYLCSTANSLWSAWQAGVRSVSSPDSRPSDTELRASYCEWCKSRGQWP